MIKLLSGLLLLVLGGGVHAATIDLVERAQTDTTAVKAGSGADNPGDIMVFHNPVYDAANKAKLGTDQGYCVRIVPGKSYECHWTLFLAQGQLVVDGPYYDTADSTLAIVGGTGAYAGAHGEMLLHAMDAKGTLYGFRYRVMK